MPEDVHHSPDLDVGVDRISARARLVSIESKSSTASVKARFAYPNPWTIRRVPRMAAGLSVSSPSSTNTIDSVGEEGPRVRTSLKIELPRFRDFTGFPTPNSFTVLMLNMAASSLKYLLTIQRAGAIAVARQPVESPR